MRDLVDDEPSLVDQAGRDVAALLPAEPDVDLRARWREREGAVGIVDDQIELVGFLSTFLANS